jgi:hypothetical protein
MGTQTVAWIGTLRPPTRQPGVRRYGKTLPEGISLGLPNTRSSHVPLR